MKSRIVKIGNSRGIRLPKPIIEQAGITEHVDIEVKANRIIIHPLSNPREGWDEAFKKMAEHQDDELIDGDEPISHSWDETEWQW